MFAKRIFPDSWQIITMAICSVLHQRWAWRLSIIIAGIVFAKGRRTVTSWFRAIGITRRYKAFYYFVGSIGRKTQIIATVLFEVMIKLIYRNENRVLMAIDDSPTKRYGPEAAGAGIHRNPTISLQLLAKMHLRVNDIKSVPEAYKIGFQNKLAQAAELVKWAQKCCKRIRKELWIVTDGGFTKAGFLKPVMTMGRGISFEYVGTYDG